TAITSFARRVAVGGVVDRGRLPSLDQDRLDADGDVVRGRTVGVDQVAHRRPVDFVGAGYFRRLLQQDREAGAGSVEHRAVLLDTAHRDNDGLRAAGHYVTAQSDEVRQ